MGGYSQRIIEEISSRVFPEEPFQRGCLSRRLEYVSSRRVRVGHPEDEISRRFEGDFEQDLEQDVSKMGYREVLFGQGSLLEMSRKDL